MEQFLPELIPEMCDTGMCVLPDDFEDQLDQIKDCGDLLGSYDNRLPDELDTAYTETQQKQTMQYNSNNQVQAKLEKNQCNYPTIEDLIDQYVNPGFHGFEELPYLDEPMMDNACNQILNGYDPEPAQPETYAKPQPDKAYKRACLKAAPDSLAPTESPSVSCGASSKCSPVDDWLEDLLLTGPDNEPSIKENAYNETDEVEDFFEYGVLLPISLNNLNCHQMDYTTTSYNVGSFGGNSVDSEGQNDGNNGNNGHLVHAGYPHGNVISSHVISNVINTGNINSGITKKLKPILHKRPGFGKDSKRRKNEDRTITSINSMKPITISGNNCLSSANFGENSFINPNIIDASNIIDSSNIIDESNIVDHSNGIVEHGMLENGMLENGILENSNIIEHSNIIDTTNMTNTSNIVNNTSHRIVNNNIVNNIVNTNLVNSNSSNIVNSQGNQTIVYPKFISFNELNNGTTNVIQPGTSLIQNGGSFMHNGANIIQNGMHSNIIQQGTTNIQPGTHIFQTGTNIIQTETNNSNTIVHKSSKHCASSINNNSLISTSQFNPQSIKTKIKTKNKITEILPNNTNVTKNMNNHVLLRTQQSQELSIPTGSGGGSSSLPLGSNNPLCNSLGGNNQQKPVRLMESVIVYDANNKPVRLLRPVQNALIVQRTTTDNCRLITRIPVQPGILGAASTTAPAGQAQATLPAPGTSYTIVNRAATNGNIIYTPQATHTTQARNVFWKFPGAAAPIKIKTVSTTSQSNK